MEKVYDIRYNTKSTDDTNRWRLICDNQEILVSDIVITSNTKTTSVWVEELNEYKYHITCSGILEIKNNIAYITSERESKIFKRHVLKTISYRFLATSVTILGCFYYGLGLEASMLFGTSELVLKPFLYFSHERLWYGGKKWFKK